MNLWGRDDRKHNSAGATALSGGKPVQLISGQPKAAAMGLYHFMRVRDPFAEDSTAALEAELTAFVARLKEQAVTATLMAGATDEQRKAVQAIHYGALGAEKEIAYYRKVSWSKPDATAAEVVTRVENETLGNLKYILHENSRCSLALCFAVTYFSGSSLLALFNRCHGLNSLHIGDPMRSSGLAVYVL